MEFTSDKKSAVLLDLLSELMGEMKSSSGKKLKPAAATLEVESEPEVIAVIPEGEESEEVEGDEPDLEALMSDEDEPEVPKSGASARLAKRLAAAKR